MVFRHLNNHCLYIIAIIIFSLDSAFALDFSKCKEYYNNASIAINGIRAVHIGDGRYLAYSSKDIESSSIIKKDSILGLYLFKDKTIPLKFDIVAITKQSLKVPMVAVNEDSTTLGNITKTQQSFINVARFSKTIPPNSVIGDICYQMYGISVGSDGFIDKTYIDKFLNTTNTEHSSIGVSVIDSKNGVVVDTINPLIGLELQKGDIIVSINDKHIKDSNQFVDTIAQIMPNSDIDIMIQRDSKNLTFRIKTIKNHSLYGASFLEPFGIVIDNNLNIISNSNVSKNNGFSFIKPNDKILMINHKNIQNIQELNHAIEDSLNDNEMLILLVRNNFEFFITIQKEDLNEI